ncbi:E3 ubiquitin-protein ligase TRIM71-like [Glandiceps talaboti]
MASKDLKSPEIDENFLTCGICSERYKSARRLPCLHSFCEQCIGRLVDSGRVCCPLCRTQHDISKGGVVELPTDPMICDFLKQMDKPAGSQCGGCDKQGSTTKYCLECIVELCETCAGTHARLPTTRSHKVIDCEDYHRLSTTDPASVQPPTRCIEHGENKLKFFCDTCNIAICLECTATNHPLTEHKYRYLEDAAAEVKTKLIGMIDTLTIKENEISNSATVIKEMEASLEQRFRVTEEKINEHIDKTIEDVTCQVRANGNELLTELRGYCNKHRIHIRAQLKEIEGISEDLTHVKEFAERLVTYGTPTQVMSTRDGVTSQIDKLLTLKTRLRPVESDDVEFQPSDDFCEGKSLGELKVTSYVIKDVPKFTRISDDIIITAGKRGSTCDVTKATTDDVNAVMKTPDNKTEEIKVTDNEDGTFSLTGVGEVEGKHKISVAVYNVPVQGSPVSVKVMPQKGLACRFGESGSGKGQLSSPYGVMLTKKRNVLVCDTYNRRLQIFTINGDYQDIIKFTDFQKTFTPMYAAMSVNGNIYITDIANNQVLVCDENLKLIRCFGKDELKSPFGIAINPNNGRIYVVDYSAHCVHIYSVDHTYIKSFGSHGNGAGQFNNPYCVCITGNGNVIVSDCGNHRMQVFSEDGEYIQFFGSEGSEEGQLSTPEGVLTDGEGFVYVCDYRNNRVQKFDSNFRFVCYVNGADEELKRPTAICITDDEPLGKLVVSEYGGKRISVFNQ